MAAQITCITGRLLCIILLVAMANLQISTYNSNGLGDGRLEHIKQIMTDADILLIQEHWQHENQLDIFEKKIDGVCSHGVSGMANNTLLVGRPFGGCAILWKQSLICPISPVSCKSKRMCATKITIDSKPMLIVNLYMPCDINNVQYSEEYKSILYEVSELCIHHNTDHLIIGGDLNTDFTRRESWNTQSLELFNSKEGLVTCISGTYSKVDYTYESKITGHKSTLDHFIVSENLFPHITSYWVTHIGTNLSDHSDVHLRLNIPTSYLAEDVVDPTLKIKWDLASPKHVLEYQEKLDYLLSQINVPYETIYCTDVHCNFHCTNIQEFYDAIVKACIEAASCTIPMSHGACPQVTGWNEHVEGFKQQALFWHNVWKDNNSPRTGLIADIRKRTRAKYHYAIRFVRKNKETCAANNMANALLYITIGNTGQKLVRSGVNLRLGQIV
jgi:endonuclease/exonuclease/phosphatase family metal-dependent hydrolase